MVGIDHYITKQGKRLRCGYTTGSCAAGAAKAAVIIYEAKRKIDYVEIDTPAGISLKLEVTSQKLEENQASCSIVKDAGDDPDKTDGIEIFAKIKEREDNQIKIDGGIGVGRITRKGLFGEIGEAAINPVPRKMIMDELKKVTNKGYDITIFAPQGEAIGKSTFNSRLGIEGGISIIGTKGIVYPMSDDAILKTIYMEIDMIRDKYGRKEILLVPGNYGEKIAEDLGLKKPMVKISNYIGESIKYIYNENFESVSLLGHIGKFSKLSIGIFNTHSEISDVRMEAFIYYLAMMKAPYKLLEKVGRAVTAEEALNICIENGYGEIIKRMEEGSKSRLQKYLKDNDYPIKVKIYSMERGVNIC